MKKGNLLLYFLISVIMTMAFVFNYREPKDVKAAYMPSTYEGVTCVKIIKNTSYIDLEDEVNKFIRDKIILDIDYGVGADNYENHFSCCIHYIQ